MTQLINGNLDKQFVGRQLGKWIGRYVVQKQTRDYITYSIYKCNLFIVDNIIDKTDKSLKKVYQNTDNI